MTNRTYSSIPLALVSLLCKTCDQRLCPLLWPLLGCSNFPARCGKSLHHLFLTHLINSAETFPCPRYFPAFRLRITRSTSFSRTCRVFWMYIRLLVVLENVWNIKKLVIAVLRPLVYDRLVILEQVAFTFFNG